MENRKINAETNSHGDKLSTRTNAFHQLFHACCNHHRQPPLSLTRIESSTQNETLPIYILLWYTKSGSAE